MYNVFGGSKLLNIYSKAPLRNFHVVQIVAPPVNKSGTAYCLKHLV